MERDLEVVRSDLGNADRPTGRLTNWRLGNRSEWRGPKGRTYRGAYGNGPLRTDSRLAGSSKRSLALEPFPWLPQLRRVAWNIGICLPRWVGGCMSARQSSSIPRGVGTPGGRRSQTYSGSPKGSQSASHSAASYPTACQEKRHCSSWRTT